MQSVDYQKNNLGGFCVKCICKKQDADFIVFKIRTLCRSARIILSKTTIPEVFS
jgi:hypothetical protein